jgi:endonuclease/exonuclease/phosphatase family metal-dependent hydrolase
MTLFNETQRNISARALTNDGAEFPDVICFQEVESLIAVRRFNEAHLGSAYPYALVIDSRDFRQIDVGILSKRPILDVRSYVDEPDPVAAGRFLFSRDCLEVEISLPNNRQLTLFINHLKSKYAENAADRATGDELRRRQSQKVADIVRGRFPGQRFNEGLFAVLGDLNDEAASPSVSPLTRDLGLVDAFARISIETDRWTHWWRSENEVSHLDYMLLSPALAALAGGPPRIERRGLSFARVLADGTSGPRLTTFKRAEDDPNPEQVSFQFPRFPEVTPADYASDHCPVFFTIP